MTLSSIGGTFFWKLKNKALALCLLKVRRLLAHGCPLLDSHRDPNRHLSLPKRRKCSPWLWPPWARLSSNLLGQTTARRTSRTIARGVATIRSRRPTPRRVPLRCLPPALQSSMAGTQSTRLPVHRVPVRWLPPRSPTPPLCPPPGSLTRQPSGSWACRTPRRGTRRRAWRRRLRRRRRLRLWRRPRGPPRRQRRRRRRRRGLRQRRQRRGLRRRGRR